MKALPIRLRRLGADLAGARPAVQEFPDVRDIVASVRRDGDFAVAEIAKRLGDPTPRAVTREEMRHAYDSIDESLRSALGESAGRIADFAAAQRASIGDLTQAVAGGSIGHRMVPVRRVGAYVPGGRYPLVSSLLMSVVTARAAGVREVAVCSPSFAPEILAAAHIAGTDSFYVAGGAQAVATMAFGTRTVPRVDLIVGPGNVYVTAAKRLVYGECGIDSLAGPSEILVIASWDADPAFVAADLIAQAEHDVHARPMLFTDDANFADAVDDAIEQQLSRLPTRGIAARALAENGSCTVLSLDAAMEAANHLAPEHLHLQGARAEAMAERAREFGALFIGAASAEAFGDYGAGPNHVLPTGGSARFSAGLSVLTFLNARTFQRFETAPPDLIARTALLASTEGLEGHRRSALMRATTEIPD